MSAVWKIMAGPAAACVAFLILSVTSVALFLRADASVEAAFEASSFSRDIREIALGLGQAHSGLLRTVNWATQNVDTTSIASGVERASAVLAENLEAARAITPDPELAAAMDKLVADIERYQAAFSQVAEMISIDVFLATMSQNDMQSQFEAVGRDLEAISDTAFRASRETRRQVDELFELILVTIIIVSAAGFVIALGVSILAGRNIANPLNRMAQAMQRLADGDHEIDIPSAERRDEIGRMAETVAVFRENAVARAQLQAQAEENTRAIAARAERLSTLIDAFDTDASDVLGDVSRARAQLDGAVATLHNNATNSAERSRRAAAAAESTTVNLNTVASAAEELTNSFDEMLSYATRSRDVADAAVTGAAASGEKIQQLSDAADRVGGVVRLISAVSEQTKLLSLNATIEAARAGEAGRGFAVVAQEVKKLATEASDATDKIAEQIADIQGLTTGVVEANERIVATISSINEMSESMNAAITQQSEATGEISRNLQIAVQGTHEVMESISAVSDSAGGTQASVVDMQGAGETLRGSTDMLQGRIKTFLSSITD